MSTSPLTRLSFPLLAALILLAGCGLGGVPAGSDGSSRWGGPQCVDSAGFPVPCNHPDARAFKPGGATPATGWAGNLNATWIADADGTLVTIDAEAPHGMRLGVIAVPDLSADANARVFWFDEPVGSIALVRTATGDTVAALVADDGTYLDLTIDGGGLVLRRTAIEAPLVTDPATAPTGATNDAPTPVLPAGMIPGEEIDLTDLASTDVLVEAP